MGVGGEGLNGVTRVGEAPLLVAGPIHASIATRVARALSSSLYLFGVALTLTPSWNESPHQTRHDTVRKPKLTPVSVRE